MAKKEKEAKAEELTGKQKRFCEEYIFDFNGTRAAKAAGYSEDTAAAIASENLTKPYIQQYIKELQSDLEKTSGISRLKVLREHEKLAFSSIAHLHNTWIERIEFDKLTDEQKSCIAEIQSQIRKTSVVREGQPEMDIETEFVKIKLYDKQKSLDSISRMLGFEAPERIEHSIPLKSYKIVAAGGEGNKGK
jgi:phage terminase small subunit